MLRHTSATLAASLALTSIALAGGKGKDKPLLPAYILNAHTVTVLVDPTAGISIDDPRANQVAQEDVEAALLKWGRFMPVLSTQQTDLIIVIRKGSGKLANVTISDPRQNNRAGVITPIDGGVGIGAQQGRPPVPSNNPSGDPSQSAHPQAEVGGREDSFLVYEGKVDHPLDGIPGWRYQSGDALHAHNVPAVDKFRKAIEEAEKAAAAKKSQQKPQSTTSPASSPQNPPASPQSNP